jgi:hypothetical protein
MKRIIIYVLILIALLFVPVKDNDIGKLQPVEVVQVYRQGQQVTIRTDTGDLGVGNTAQLALQNLKDTTPGYIYLDTAEYLLMNMNAAQDVEQLRSVLKKNLQICVAESELDLQLAAKFLPAHGKLPCLKGWHMGDKLPELSAEGERLKFVKKNVEKS